MFPLKSIFNRKNNLGTVSHVFKCTSLLSLLHFKHRLVNINKPDYLIALCAGSCSLTFTTTASVKYCGFLISFPFSKRQWNLRSKTKLIDELHCAINAYIHISISKRI